MNTRQQGALGVAKAISHFASNGYSISLPIADSQRYDLIVDNGTLLRVECKTSSYQKLRGNTAYYNVALKTSGGNRSWNKKPVPINADDCDLLFVHCLGGPNYLIPTASVNGRGTLQLSPKWDRYKI